MNTPDPAKPSTAHTFQPDSILRSDHQNALFQSEQRFRHLALASSDSLYSMSADWGQMLNLKGMNFLTDTEQASTTWLERYIPPVEHARVEQAIDQAIQHKQTFELEHQVFRADGSIGWTLSRAVPVLDEQGQIQQWFGAASDITPRKQAEDALRQSETKYRTLFETNNEAICLIEQLPLRADGRRDYRYINMNPAMQSLFRIADLSGQSIRDHFPDEVEDWYDDYDRVLQTGQAIRFERLSEPQGMILEMTVSRVEDGSGPRLLIVMRDISASKQVEQVLKLADQRKDEFLAMLAHELRNPLAPVRNGLQLLAQTYQEDQLLGTLLPVMNRQMDHLMRLVDDLLDVSRISQGKIELRKQRVDLTGVVAQAVDAVQPLFTSAGKQLRTELPDYPLYLDGDATRLHQVVTNLLTNGLRYTHQDGQVWLHLSQVDQQAVLQVEDNGIGLTVDQLQRIFGLFVQVDNSLARSHGGLGVGLSLVQELVHQHGGQVEAQSQGLGQGSVFLVYLPLLHP